MPWLKIDDGFHSHPKIIAAGNAATGLFVRLGSYCSQHSTDGFVPAALAKAYGTRAEIARLLDIGLIVPHVVGYEIPDFLDFNPSAAATEAKRAARAEAGRRGGLASGRSRRTEPNGEAIASGLVEAKPNPVPSRPVPSTSSSTDTSPSSSVSHGPTDDDGFDATIELIVGAKERAWQGRITNHRRWRMTVRTNTVTEDGELIQRMLADGDPPDKVALFVLGHGDSTAEERSGTPWCTPACPDCAGTGYIAGRDANDRTWAEPCPQRPT